MDLEKACILNNDRRMVMDEGHLSLQARRVYIDERRLFLDERRLAIDTEKR